MHTTRTIWLIRHGESESNAGLPSSDPTAVPITPRGRQQSLAVAQAFTQPPDLIVVSRFPQVPVEEWPVHEFTYLGLPGNQRLTHAAREPLSRAYWERCDPAFCAGDGAESFHALLERARRCLAQLSERSEQFIAIFGHGRFTQTLLWLLLAQPTEVDTVQMRDFRDFCHGLRLPNGAIVPLRYSVDEGFWIGQTRTAHLADAG